MNFDRLLLALNAALAIALLTATCVSHGKSLSAVHAALLSLPIFHEDRAPELAETKAAQLKAIAAAVEKHGRNRTVRAATLAYMYEETKLSLRIHRGDCRKWECDYSRRLKVHLARGIGQLHRNGMPEDKWERMAGVEHTDEQVAEVARRVRGAIGYCRGDVRGAFVLLGNGRTCQGGTRTTEARMATFERVRRRL